MATLKRTRASTRIERPAEQRLNGTRPAGGNILFADRQADWRAPRKMTNDIGDPTFRWQPDS